MPLTQPIAIAPDSGWSVPAGRLLRFGVVSGLGWALDFGVFSLLLHLGFVPFVANVVGASLAVTWVYFASVRRIFRYGGPSLRSRFIAYAIYQVVGITLASWAVAGLVQLTGLAPLLAKVAVTPLTFLANYLFMAWLTRPQAAYRGAVMQAGRAPRILVFVPMYQCERQIARVLGRIESHLSAQVHEVLVVDNGSRDRSREVATAALAALNVPGTLLLNDSNFNLGGSHKVAFAYAIAGDFDWVVVVHGDDQAEPADLVPLLAAGALHDGVDALLGSRFSRGAQRIGYAWHRTCGNHVFNLIFTLACGRRVEDLGSGLNAFRVGWLREAGWSNLADDLTFNIHLLLRLVHSRARFRFFPIIWREEDQISNVRLFRQAWRTLGIAWGYFLGRGAYLARNHARQEPDAYRATVESANGLKRTPAAMALN